MAGLIGSGGLVAGGSAAADEGDDAAGKVLVGAGQPLDLDGDAGLLGDLAAHALLEGSPQAPGPSRRAPGLPSGFRFHDLRHTGNHLAATAGASTRELMHQTGHGSMRAALIYQHTTGERDRAIARRLDDLVQYDEHDDG